MSGDEAQHTLPRVGGSLGIFGGPPIKETMGRAGIGDNLMLHAGPLQGLIQRLDLVGGNGRVGSAKEAQDWSLDEPGGLEHAPFLFVPLSTQPGVEADDTG